MDIEKLFKEVLDCSFVVHKRLGPGLLENVYTRCLVYELKKRGYHTEYEKALPVTYDDLTFEYGYRVDIMVEGCIIVEVKSVVEMRDVYLSQILTYMRLSDIKLGLLVNFNNSYLKDGIRRVML